ncbi:unnamed protein product [Brassicogethes aeneus]|uniref:Uncharacterized protein n=1 Tax=Brassicogethes aeneus TaxID=1431903 RepID=A0A9P0APW0_BRAAE|nr:unnamed protein product [Brassicogethes aeneus]
MFEICVLCLFVLIKSQIVLKEDEEFTTNNLMVYKDFKKILYRNFITFKIYGDSDCGYKVDWFIKNCKYPVRTGFTKPLILETSISVLFLSELASLNLYVNKINVHDYVFCVLCPKLNNEPNLQETLAKFWNYKILNFVFIYRDTGFQFLTYNPFQNATIYLNQSKALFPEKLVNLHHHKFNVGAYIDFPKNVKKNNKWVGADFNLLYKYVKVRNATYEIFETTQTNLTKLLQQKIVDFTFVPSFVLLENSAFALISYPVTMDNVVIVVPRPKIIFGATFSNAFVQFAVLFMLPLILTITAKLLSKNVKFFDLLFRLYSPLVLQSIKTLDKQKKTIRILIFSLIVFALITSITYQDGLKVQLLKPKYVGDIKTINELRDSGLKINIKDKLISSIPTTYGLNKQLIPSVYSQIYDKIFNKSVYEAFILPNSKASALFKHDGAKMAKKYNYINEYLVPGFNVSKLGTGGHKKKSRNKK